MENKEVSLATLLRQEQELQFTTFSNAMAFELGNLLIAEAESKQQSIAVNITRNGQVLFFHGMNGTSQDNAHWIYRKSNLVNRTGHSSFYTHTDIANKGGDFDNVPTLDPREYAAHGGSFPLIIKGTGLVGTITVSGLPGAEDHALAVRVLKKYLKVEGDF